MCTDSKAHTQIDPCVGIAWVDLQGLVEGCLGQVEGGRRIEIRVVFPERPAKVGDPGIIVGVGIAGAQYQGPFVVGQGLRQVQPWVHSEAEVVPGPSVVGKAEIVGDHRVAGLDPSGLFQVVDGLGHQQFGISAVGGRVEGRDHQAAPQGVVPFGALRGYFDCLSRCLVGRGDGRCGIEPPVVEIVGSTPLQEGRRLPRAGVMGGGRASRCTGRFGVGERGITAVTVTLADLHFQQPSEAQGGHRISVGAGDLQRPFVGLAGLSEMIQCPLDISVTCGSRR